MNSIVHDFAERKAWSNDLGCEKAWVAFYLSIWPEMISCVRIDKDCEWQRHGVDRMVILPNGKTVLVDEKKRDKNKTTGKVYDDFALEEYSNLERKTCGWTLDASKRCDYIAYAIIPLGKAYLLPYELLRITCTWNLLAWKERFPRYGLAPNPGYHTRNWFIPWDVLFEAMRFQMRRKFDGNKLELPTATVLGNQSVFEWQAT